MATLKELMGDKKRGDGTVFVRWVKKNGHRSDHDIFFEPIVWCPFSAGWYGMFWNRLSIPYIKLINGYELMKEKRYLLLTKDPWFSGTCRTHKCTCEIKRPSEALVPAPHRPLVDPANLDAVSL